MTEPYKSEATRQLERELAGAQRSDELFIWASGVVETSGWSREQLYAMDKAIRAYLASLGGDCDED